jgi:hypothetical protein
MTPFERALRAVPIECPGRQVFVVNLALEQLRITLTVTPSAQRADRVALVARQVIAGHVAQALRDEDCRIAAEIDEAYLANKIWCPAQASTLCRKLAETHVLELNARANIEPLSPVDLLAISGDAADR